ncbi:MAG: helix-turn-helix domain-containing protein [Micromonosporaceae bacterium]|nr:helix-turn-helix domain-containing protein [Micromonosporaceae bacterium]
MTDEELPILPGFREMAERETAEREELRSLVADLVAQRRAAGLSQDEVARRMGTSQPAVARLEAGMVDARMSTVQRYAGAVGAQLHLRTTRMGEPDARH